MACLFCTDGDHDLCIDKMPKDIMLIASSQTCNCKDCKEQEVK